MLAISFHSTLEHRASCETAPMDSVSCYHLHLCPSLSHYFSFLLFIILLQPLLGLHIVLGGSNSKPDSLWQRNSSSVYVHSTFIFAVALWQRNSSSVYAQSTSIFCSVTWIAADFCCAHLHISSF